MTTVRDQRPGSKGSKRRNRSKSNKGGLGCFGIVWMLMVLVFDGIIGYGFFRTWDAKTRYLPTEGRIVASGVSSSADSDGTTYAAEIEYEFDLAGTTHQGDKYSYFDISSSSRSRARKITEKYPVGASVTVYYDPGAPEQNVLEIDSSSFPNIVIIFMTPFHCIGLGMLTGGIVGARHNRRNDGNEPVSPYIAKSNEESMELRDAHWPGWAVFFFVTGLSSFAAVFIVAIGFGLDVNRQLALWVWAACIGAGLLVPTLMRLKRQKNAEPLFIDWMHSRFSRGESQNIEIADIQTIRLSSYNTNTKVNNRPWMRHEIEGIAADGSAHTLLIAKGYAKRGTDIRDWFAQRFEAAADESADSDADSSPSMPVVSEVDINRTNS